LNDVYKKLEYANKCKIKNLILSNYNPYFDGADPATLNVNNQEFLKIKVQLSKKYSSNINIIWPTPVRDIAKIKTEIKKCTLPFNYIHLDSSGDTAPCCYRYPKPEYGNILRDKTAWNSEFNQNLRQNLLSSKEPIGECKSCENL